MDELMSTSITKWVKESDIITVNAKSAYRVHRQGDDIEEPRLALCNSSLATVHERGGGLAKGLLAVTLTEHLLHKVFHEPF